MTAKSATTSGRDCRGLTFPARSDWAARQRQEAFSNDVTGQAHGVLTITEVARTLRCSKSYIHQIGGQVFGVKRCLELKLGRGRIVLRPSLQRWIYGRGQGARLQASRVLQAQKSRRSVRTGMKCKSSRRRYSHPDSGSCTGPANTRQRFGTSPRQRGLAHMAGLPQLHPYDASCRRNVCCVEAKPRQELVDRLDCFREMERHCTK